MAERALIDNNEECTGQPSPSAGHLFPKDSKWAWIVCLCSFQTQVLILGILHAFGVFFVELIEEFQTTKAKAAWIGSVAYGLSMLVGPFVSMLVGKYSHRPVMMAGGMLCAVSVLSSSFIKSVSLLFCTFSVLFGIGAGLAITPTMTIGSEYFDKYASISVGIMTAGSSVGTLITAPLAQTLIRAMGWRNTFRFFAGTCLLTVLCNTLMRPITKKRKTQLEKIRTSPLRRMMTELKLWKNRVFIVWTIGITCVMFGYYIPYVHLVSYAVDNGISQEQGSILMMLFGAVTALGRVLFGKVVQYGFLNRLHMHQLSMVITGTGTMLLPLIKNFEGLAAYVILVGLVDGCYVVLLPLLTCSLVGAEQAVLAWGFLIGASSITFTLGPPVAGFMFDSFGSYNTAFHVAALPVLTGAAILFLVPWAQRTSADSNIIKAISVLDAPDSEETSTVDFVTLSKCNSLMEQEGDRKSDTMSTNAMDINSLCFSDINQVTVVPRSQGSHRGLRDVDFALSALQKNDQVLSKMLGGTSRHSGDKRSGTAHAHRKYSPSSSTGRTTLAKTEGINISTPRSVCNRCGKQIKSCASFKRHKRVDDVAVQADLTTANSRMSPLQMGLGSSLSGHHQNPTAAALCQAILALELQQSAAGAGSETSRASMLSENHPITPQLEEFVIEQLEKLRDCLRSPFVSSPSSARMQSVSEEHQGMDRMSRPQGDLGNISNYRSQTLDTSSLKSPTTKSTATQTDKYKDINDLPPGTSSQHSISAQETTSCASNQTDGYKRIKGSTPVDIPSAPNEDSPVFSMDPLSPFGSPPVENQNIPTLAHLTDSKIEDDCVVIPSLLDEVITLNDGDDLDIPHINQQESEHMLMDSPSLNTVSTSSSSRTKESVSPKTLSLSADGIIFKMDDESHSPYVPSLQPCTEVYPRDDDDPLPSVFSEQSGVVDEYQTGRFTVYPATCSENITDVHIVDSSQQCQLSSVSAPADSSAEEIFQLDPLGSYSKTSLSITTVPDCDTAISPLHEHEVPAEVPTTSQAAINDILERMNLERP